MILSRDNPVQSSVPPTLSPWRISTERYLEMACDGVFEGDRVELINGIIIDKSPARPKHADVIDRLNELFFPIRGEHRVRIQNTLVVAEGQVYDPDFMLLKSRPASDPYATRHPQPDDVALLIEVCGSSLAKDRDIKLPVYAGAGVPELWLVDLETESVGVYRDPSAQGYKTAETAKAGQSLTPACLPGQTIGVAAMFA